MTPEIVFVVARADNGAIGLNNKLPWHLPADLRHFKAVTAGAAMIMGRRTFESLGRLLPGRRHVVLTRDPLWQAEGVEVAHDPDEALMIAGDGRISVIGGAEVFAVFHDRADRIELTEVHAAPDGDTFLPGFAAAHWRETQREDHPAEDGRPAYSFVTLERAQAGLVASRLPVPGRRL